MNLKKFVLAVHVAALWVLTSASLPCAQEKKEDKDEKGVKYHRVERSSSFVKRSIRMPDSADLSQIKVRLLHGQAALFDGSLHHCGPDTKPLWALLACCKCIVEA